jgi:hypothetical protein
VIMEQCCTQWCASTPSGINVLTVVSILLLLVLCCPAGALDLPRGHGACLLCTSQAARGLRRPRQPHCSTSSSRSRQRRGRALKQQQQQAAAGWEQALVRPRRSTSSSRSRQRRGRALRQQQQQPAATGTAPDAAGMLQHQAQHKYGSIPDAGRFRGPFLLVAAGDWFWSQHMGPHSPREAPHVCTV